MIAFVNQLVNFQDTSSLGSQTDSTAALGSVSGGGGGGSSRIGGSIGHPCKDTSSITFHRAWELQEEKTEVQVYDQKDQDIKTSRRARIAKYVATTGEVLNLSNVAEWFGEDLEDRDGFVPRTMLSLPIFNGQRTVIGVAQLINKREKRCFVESDIVLFEAFAIFCGIGIHNTKMYEGACKLMAKQKVALDCLSYHAAAADEDTDELAKSQVPEAESVALYSYKFNDGDMSVLETCKVTLRMFMEFNLINQFQIPYKVRRDICRV